MKKFIVIITSLLLFAGIAGAQPKQIGFRLGGDAEISYQHWLGNRFLETDLGFTFGKYGGLRVSAIYDFIILPVKNFNLYVGPGAQVGMYGKVDADGNSSNVFGIGIGGQIGGEYNFAKAPFSLSLDWRPMWNIIGGHAIMSSAALGIRYRF